jgi:hypothetical protein
MAKILEYVTIKLLGVVDYYLSKHSKVTYYILLEKSPETRCCDVDLRIRLYPFGEIFYHHYCILVVSLCGCQWSHDVDALSLQWSRWCDEL